MENTSENLVFRNKIKSYRGLKSKSLIFLDKMSGRKSDSHVWGKSNPSLNQEETKA